MLNRFSENEWSSGDREVPSSQTGRRHRCPAWSASTHAVTRQRVRLRRSSATSDFQLDLAADASPRSAGSRHPATGATTSPRMDFLASDDDLDTAGLDWSFTGGQARPRRQRGSRVPRRPRAWSSSEFTELPAGLDDRSSASSPSRSPTRRRPASRRRWRCRTGSGAAAASPTTTARRPAATAPTTWSRFLARGPGRPHRLLRAVRRVDGGDGPRARHPGPGGGRLPAAPTRSATTPTSTAPTTCTPGPSCSSPAPAGCASSRPRRPRRRPCPTTPPRPIDRPRRRPRRRTPSDDRRSGTRVPQDSASAGTPLRTRPRRRRTAAAASRGCRSCWCWSCSPSSSWSCWRRAPCAGAAATSAACRRPRGRRGTSCATPRCDLGLPWPRAPLTAADPPRRWSSCSARRPTSSPRSARAAAPRPTRDAVVALDRIVHALERLRYARARRPAAAGIAGARDGARPCVAGAQSAAATARGPAAGPRGGRGRLFVRERVATPDDATASDVPAGARSVRRPRLGRQRARRSGRQVGRGHVAAEHGGLVRVGQLQPPGSRRRRQRSSIRSMKEPDEPRRLRRCRRGPAGAAAVDDGEAAGGVHRGARVGRRRAAACWPRIAVSATVAEPSMTTKPAMPIAKPTAPVPLITPAIRIAMPSTKTTPATIARRRAERRSEVPRRVEANLGSSSTRARSICSSSRSSSSESGTGSSTVVRARACATGGREPSVGRARRFTSVFTRFSPCEYRSHAASATVSGRAGWPAGPRRCRTAGSARSTARSASDQPRSRSPRTPLAVHGGCAAPAPRPGPRPAGAGRAAARGRRRGATAVR